MQIIEVHEIKIKSQDTRRNRLRQIIQYFFFYLRKQRFARFKKSNLIFEVFDELLTRKFTGIFIIKMMEASLFKLRCELCQQVTEKRTLMVFVSKNKCWTIEHIVSP